MTKLIHHIILFWDESEHLSPKRSKELSSKFWTAYLQAFPMGSQTKESPAIITTESRMFARTDLTSFWHKGELVSYKGDGKDLAIVKYASTGLIDQNRGFHFIVDDYRKLRQENGDPPLMSNDLCLVVFITSDRGKGMAGALRTVFENKRALRTNFASLIMEKRGAERMEVAGLIVGQELKTRFRGLKDGGLLLDIDFAYDNKKKNGPSD